MNQRYSAGRACCEVKSASCNGQDLARVQFRSYPDGATGPRRNAIYEEAAKVCCQGCRVARWGAFRYVRGAFQQELITKEAA